MYKIDGKYGFDTVSGIIVNTRTGVAIPDDEPVFLFPARDNLACLVLSFYAWLCSADGCTASQIEGVADALHKFTTFKLRNPQKMKQPD